MATKITVAQYEETVLSDNEKPRSYFREFTERTFLHGIKSVTDPGYWVLRRLFWVVLILLMTGFLVGQLVLSVLKYRSFPSTVNVDIVHHEKMSLPDVTICNNNYAGKAFMDTQPADIKALLLEEEMSSYNAHELSQDYWSFSRQIMDPLDKFVSRCAIGSTDIDCKDHIEISPTWIGNCYTLSTANYSLDPYPLSAMGGLSFEVSVNESDHHHGVVLVSPGIGIKLMFHDHGETPDENWAVNVQPDLDVHIAVTKFQDIHLGTPYSSEDCQGADDMPTSFTISDVYTKKRCQMQCYSDFLRKNYNCTFPKGMNGFYGCSVVVVLGAYHDGIAYATGPECKCLRPCTKTIYTTQMSALAYPASVQNPLSSMDQSQTKAQQSQIKKIRVTVFYPTFDMIVMTQEASYMFVSFLADVGGQMGLFLGASLLTVTEFLEFFTMSVFRKLRDSGKNA